MARQPSRTPFVILGLLTVEPMSGYDVKAAIDRSISQFWSESYGQLYPALKKLHEQGYVTRSEGGSGNRVRHVYAITDAGRRALHQWLTEPVSPRLVRNEMLLKLFFGRHLEREVLLRHLRRELATAEGEARGIGAVVGMLQTTQSEAPDLQYWLLTLDLGRRTAQARAEWARATLDRLSELDPLDC